MSSIAERISSQGYFWRICALEFLLCLGQLYVQQLNQLIPLDALGVEEVMLEFAAADKAILVRPIHSRDGERGLIMPVKLNPQ